MQNADIKEDTIQNDRLFGDIYAAFYPRLKAYALKFVSSDDAEDIIQDTFLYALNRRGKLDFGEKFFYYLLRSVHNSCVNRIRKQARKDDMSSYLTSMKCDWYSNRLDTISQQLYNDEIYHAIETAVSSLPKKCGDIFRMSYYDRYKSKDIAEALNLSVRTVESQIYKALVLLRAKLKNFYMEY